MVKKNELSNVTEMTESDQIKSVLLNVRSIINLLYVEMVSEITMNNVTTMMHPVTDLVKMDVVSYVSQSIIHYVVMVSKNEMNSATMVIPTIMMDVIILVNPILITVLLSIRTNETSVMTMILLLRMM